MTVSTTTFWLGIALIVIQLLSGLIEILEQRGHERQIVERLAVAICLVTFAFLAGPLLWNSVGPGSQDEYFRKLNNYGLCQFALERRDADRPLPGDHCPEGGEYFYSEEHKRSLCSYPPHRAILLGETTPPEVFHRPW